MMIHIQNGKNANFPLNCGFCRHIKNGPGSLKKKKSARTGNPYVGVIDVQTLTVLHNLGIN